MNFHTKRFLSILLVTLTLVTGIPFSSSASAPLSFSDVPNGAWYKPYVDRLSSKNVMGGTGGSKFSPDRTITRAEIAVMLAKTVLTSAEVDEYKNSSSFADVPVTSWYAPYIKWAQENNILGGIENNRFAPDAPITRQELATMIVKFNDAMAYKMKDVHPAKTFKDQGSIEGWASSAVQRCQKAGIIDGYGDSTFQPKGNALRCEAAAMYDRFLENAENTQYVLIRKRINGHAVVGVEFDPKAFTSDIARANNGINGAESMSSMVNRTGARFAINAAYFDMDTYSPNATIISGGKLRTIDLKYAPNKPAFVVNSEGQASIQHFKPVQTATLTKADGTQYSVSTVVTNRAPSNASDTTRIVFTRDWGSEVGILSSNYVTVDANGTVIGAGSNTKILPIPENGFVLYQRARRSADNEIFDNCQVGDTLSLTVRYEGSSVSDIQTAISAGPRITSDGLAYANYNAEGFYASDITTIARNRVCIGVKGNGRVVMLGTKGDCTMAQLSNVMLEAGCNNAINLDGGASAGIYCDGQWLLTPNRQLNNMIYFK